MSCLFPHVMHVYVVGYPVQGVGVLDAKVLVIHVGQNNVKGKEGAIVINARDHNDHCKET